MGWLDDILGTTKGDESIDQGMDYYKDQIQQAMQELQGHEAQGRGDISGSLSQALGFGQPYREAGGKALEAYQGSLGLGGGGAAKSARESFQASPGYQFALNQGLQSAQRGASAGGTTGSGAEQKALERYGTGMANQEYGGWQSKLSGLAGMGEQASQAAAGESMQAGGLLAQLGQGYSGQESGLYGQLGQAGAESGMAKAQLGQSGRAGIMGLLGQLMGMGGSLGSTAILAKMFGGK